MTSSKSSKQASSKLLLLFLPVIAILGFAGFNALTGAKGGDKQAEVLDTSSAESLVVSLKRPLAEATEALGDKNFMRAKRELGEFEEFWVKVEPMFKEKAPDAYQQVGVELKVVKDSLAGSPDQKKSTEAFEKLSKTIELNASRVIASKPSVAAEAPAEVVASLTPASITELKQPMTDGIKATNDANFTQAKGEYEKFLAAWKKSEGGVKQKSPAIFDEVEVGMDHIYVSLVEPKTPDKQKVIAAFGKLQTSLNKLN